MTTDHLDDRAIRALRPAKPAVDPWRPHGFVVEPERLPGGSVVETVTVFLSGRECPFTCVFCDLWQHTTDQATPDGALPAQVDRALAGAGPLDAGTHIKLYNASNFFDRKAVPVADHEAIAARMAPFAQVVVENHPRLVGAPCFEFAARLEGRLQVAMGLETVHPEALPRLNKQVTLDDFARAAEMLTARGVGVRAFVLIGAPFVPVAESAAWAARSAAFAFEHGAEHVALIPVRGGNGALEALAADGQFTPPTLAQAEEALDRCLALGGARDAVVSIDPWDLEDLAACPQCAPERLGRLESLSLGGGPEPAIRCDRCG